MICNKSNSMRCFVTFNEIFFLLSHRGGGIAGVNYLKVKNDVTHWKTIIPDNSQIQAASDFLLSSSFDCNSASQ